MGGACSSTPASGQPKKDIVPEAFDDRSGQESASKQAMPPRETLPGEKEVVNVDVRQQLRVVFDRFDQDGDGHLEPREVLELMHDIQRKVEDPVIAAASFELGDAEKIVFALDTDKNGTLEEEEFSSWMIRGLEKSADEFQAFMDSGPVQSKLATFLLAVKLFMVQEVQQSV